MKARSLPVSGTKAQLIERLQQRDQQQSEAEVEAESTEPTTLPQAETTESTTSKKRPDTETDEENGSNKRTKLDDSTMTEEEGKEEVPRFENAPVEEIVEAQTTNGHSGEAENGGVKENGKREEGSFNNQGTTTTAEETRRSQVEGQETTSDVKAEEQEEEEEEPPVYEVPEENENLKPTDMYLDTVSFSSFPSHITSTQLTQADLSLDVLGNRLIVPLSISISNDSVPSLYLTTTFIPVSSVANSFKEEVLNRLLMLIRLVGIITFSLISNRKK